MSATPATLSTSETKGPAKFNTAKLVFYIILIVMTGFFLMPVYVAIVTSLKGMEEVSRGTPWELPSSPTFANYGNAWEQLKGGFLNSVILSVPGVAISAVLGSMNGYVLSKWKFKGSNTLFTVILFGMFIPYQSILIPLAQFLQSINLYATIPGLILVHVVYGIPITTLIFRNYYAGVPKELIESGTIDGAGFFGIYRNIVLPLSIPSFCSGAYMAVHRDMERIPLRRHPEQQPRQPADHGGACRDWIEPGRHRLRLADGRLVDYRATHSARLYIPQPLLHQGFARGFGQGVGLVL